MDCGLAGGALAEVVGWGAGGGGYGGGEAGICAGGEVELGEGCEGKGEGEGGGEEEGGVHVCSVGLVRVWWSGRSLEVG